MIIIFNHSDQEHQIRAGDKVALLICEKIVFPTITEASSLH